jgi:hypothetical protein
MNVTAFEVLDMGQVGQDVATFGQWLSSSATNVRVAAAT